MSWEPPDFDSAVPGDGRFRSLWEVREGLETDEEILLQARALVVCALPYKRTGERAITRRAHLGGGAQVSVTFTVLGDGEMAYGADRALLGWVQTQAFNSGFVEFPTLNGFLEAFELDAGGKSYQRFRERVGRLRRLAISIETTTDTSLTVENAVAVKTAHLPRSGSYVRHRVDSEAAGQLMLVEDSYGFRLDPDFWMYLRSNPVPLPLPLMRKFHDKPQGWDFCAFTLYRCYAARSESVVPMSAFRSQLGSNDQSRRLKWRLGQFLAEMKVVYPDLPAKFVRGGLRVAPWRPRRKEAA